MMGWLAVAGLIYAAVALTLAYGLRTRAVEAVRAAVSDEGSQGEPREPMDAT
jgi:hypothetical protein